MLITFRLLQLIFWIAVETRSVSERKSSCVISSAGFFATSIGLPYNTLVLPFLGIDVPIGCSLSEPMMAVGTIGQPVSSASRAAPVCPLYSRPSELALQSLALEVFGFAHEVHHARAGNRNQSIVDHRQMVGCDNRAALSRHVIQSADSRAQTMMSNRAETFDEEPVEHLAFLPQTN